jgi:hypothetical protein
MIISILMIIISTTFISLSYSLYCEYKRNSKKEIIGKAKYVIKNFYHIFIIDILLLAAIIILIIKSYKL